MKMHLPKVDLSGKPAGMIWVVPIWHSEFNPSVPQLSCASIKWWQQFAFVPFTP